MSCVNTEKRSAHLFFFFLKASSLFSFPASSGLQNVFLAAATASAVALPAIRARPLSLPRTAPYDSCGHSQETSAPNLQSGPLPAPVRLRARAVSNSFGQLLSAVLVAKFLSAAGLRPRPFSSQNLRASFGRSASATDPRPSVGRWPRSLSCARLWSL
jgi:hypothetical protein